jgi:putative sterol carrier protein
MGEREKGFLFILKNKIMKFASDEWIKEFCRVLSASKEYNEAAKEWEGDFTFIIEASPENNFPETHLYMDLWHGICRSARVASPGEVSSEFILRGPYDVWVEVVQGKTDPIQAMLQGRIKVTGPFAKIMRNVKAAQVLVNLLKEIKTEF